MTILTKFSSHDDYFFAFCKRKKQASAPRKSMKTSSFPSAGEALVGQRQKKIPSAVRSRFALRTAQTIAMSIFVADFPEKWHVR
jgi:hypothetical protein